MSVIYEPKGKAREYSELAINLFVGCKHACKYCYCPNILRTTVDNWSKSPHPKKDILQSINRESKKMYGEERQVLLCFMSDPYQTDESSYYTRQTLLMLEKAKFKNVSVLTKAGGKAINDFDILKRNNWKFGTTLLFTDDLDRQEWEPNASTIEDRVETIKKAYTDGIYTWVSVEPVIKPEQAISIMQTLDNFVDFWKVGKLNHFAKIEKTVDWNKFYKDSKSVLQGSKVYWKQDLLKYA